MNTSPSIHYTITPEARRHIFAVRLSVMGDFAEGIQVFMPNWIAGSYMLRDFARHIVRIRAFDELGRAAKLTPINQFSWQSEAFTDGLTIEYEVFAHDTSVRAAFLDTETGFFNATSVCLCVLECEHQPHFIHLTPPTHDDNWQVATTLTRLDNTTARAFGDYMARDYDALADHPIRMGHLTWLAFTAHGVPHEIAISGLLPQLNHALLIDDVRKICEAQIALFEPAQKIAPFTHYLFLLDARQTGYGGLEHRSSTALLCARESLPNHSDSARARRKSYTDLLGLISHEYFHAWNVKRIKPASFVPYDLTEIVDTSMLWFFEGMTSYYDDLMLYRTGIIDESVYLNLLEHHVDAVARHQGQQLQTAVEAGYYAWTKYYQPSPNALNAQISYYTKGALIALCIDLFIRHNSQNRHNLDDVMRALWQQFGRDFYHHGEASAKGVRLVDIQKAIEQFAGASAFHLLQVALFTTQTLPINLLCLPQGWHLKYTPPLHTELGATVKKVENGWLIERVLTGSMAEQAGLAPQDILVALNRFELTHKPDELLIQWRHTPLQLHYWRDGVLHSCRLNNRRASAQKGHYHFEHRTPDTRDWLI